MNKTAKRKATKSKRRTMKAAPGSLLGLQKENFRFRTTLGKLSTRDFQPDEAYNMSRAQLKKERKTMMDLIANYPKKA